MVETLKAFDEIRLPDERQTMRGLSLEYLHTFAAGLTLNSTVPDGVQNQFSIARHALIYSWFCYPLNSAAEMYGLLAVENALLLKATTASESICKGARDPTLSPLLRLAIQRRWLTDAGFDLVDVKTIEVPDAIRKQYPDIPNDQRFCYSLLAWLPSIRNHLAHGTYVLRPGPSHVLQRDCELINQLFPVSETLP